MKTIVRTLFGSHLYGTNLPTSDTDYKSVHLPSASDILLIRARNTVSSKTKADRTVKNTAEDVDDESFALHFYFNMLEKGESLALELLFSPLIIEKTAEWDEIVANRKFLLTRNCKGFVGYCQRQAAKYGIRGSRVATTRAALEMVIDAADKFGSHAKLGDTIKDRTEQFVRSHEHTSFVDIDQPRGGPLRHWEVCDRKMPYTVSLKECQAILQAMFDNYGQRALAAEKNEGIDWKAVAHAVRVGNQAVELLSTGHLTFPRPEAQELLKIRRGEIAYAAVQDQLEELLVRVEELSLTSPLPENVNRAFMNVMLMNMYGGQVIAETR